MPKFKTKVLLEITVDTHNELNATALLRTFLKSSPTYRLTAKTLTEPDWEVPDEDNES